MPTILTASPALAKVDPLRNLAAVLVYWSGWLSPVGEIASYNIRISRTPASRDGQSNNVPVLEHDYFAAPAQPFTVHLRPGLYTFLLTVRNVANYTQMARRLVLVVNDEAVLGKSDRAALEITSSHGVWQSNISTVTFSWTGHFYNRFFQQNPKVLLPVSPLPGIGHEYDQLYGPISLQGTTHVDGITSFRYTVCAFRKELSQDCVSGMPSSLNQQSVSVHLPSGMSGSEISVTVTATDVLGAVASTSKSIYVDLSPPELGEVYLSSTGVPMLTDETAVSEISRMPELPFLRASAMDSESGIRHVQWTLTRWDTELEVIGSANATNLAEVSEKFLQTVKLSDTFIFLL